MTLNRLWAEYLTAVENSWPLSERRQAIEDAIRKDERERLKDGINSIEFQLSRMPEDENADAYNLGLEEGLGCTRFLLSTTTEEPQ